MSIDTSADALSVVGPDRVRTLIQGLLRAAQREWTDEMLGEATGLKARRIKAYRVEGKEPSLSAALSILTVLGRPAVNSTLALIGYVGEPLEEAEALQPMMIVAGALAHLATIGRAAADNRIDHTEAPDCQAAADAVIAHMLPLSSAGRAA